MSRRVVILSLTAFTMLFFGLTLNAGCDRSANPAYAAPPPSKQLTVVTPDNEKIRRAFQHNFSTWYANKYGPSVQFDWVVRGTPECLKYVSEGAESDDPRPIPDIMFGGGILDHTWLAEQGLSAPIKLDGAVADIPAEVDGLKTRDAEGRWYATGLSSFGILYNKAACEQRRIEPPADWADLADPRFESWIAMADPKVSGSTRESLMLILQGQGWDAGWATIMRILGNTRALVDGSSVALHQVETGVSLATFAVNFDGMALAAESNGKLVYFNPPGETAVNPTATSVLGTCKDMELATEFVRYCLSEEGQKIWSLRAEARGGMGETLYHYPINPKIYDQFADQLAVEDNPFKTHLGLKFDPELRAQNAAIALPLIAAACGDNHVALQQAWAALTQAGLPEEAVAKLTVPPLGEAAAHDAGAKLASANDDTAADMRAEWGRLFAARYKAVLESVGGERE